MLVPLLAAAGGFGFGGNWPLGLAFLGVAVFAAVGALSHEHERAFSASLIYLGLGVVAAGGLALLGVGWVDPVEDAKLLGRVAELAVVIALFSAGLKVDRPLRWRAWGTVARLLAIAMPVSIALAAAFGLAMGLSLGAAIVLGSSLAPTDPVLAGDIGIGPPGEEEEHEPHFAITAEAGFNDGLAFPFVLLGLMLAAETQDVAEWLAADVVYGILGAVALGAAFGFAIAWSIVRLRDRELLIPAFDGWFAIAATLLIYGLAEALATYGFLAVFAGGLAFRRYERDHEVNARVHNGAEIAEKFGELAVILLLGSMLTLDGLGTPGVGGWALAFGLVFLVRPLAVNLALLGSRLERPGERAFVAWFGVRGVGTLFYVAVAAAAGSPLAGDERGLVVWTAVACVIVSIVLHGITAGPLNRWLIRNVLT